MFAEYEPLRGTMLKSRPTTTLIMAMALVAVGASAVMSQDDAPLTLEDTDWELLQQAVAGALAPLAEGDEATLSLSAGQATGTGPCNDYSGTYALAGTSLTVGEIMVTQRFCDEQMADFETGYGQDLLQTASWAIEDGRLTLSDSDGGPLLVFDVATEAAILGSWAATEIADGGDEISPATADTEVTATFVDEGQMTGFDGCNDILATYELDGSGIAISGLETGELPCDDDLAALSADVHAALTSAVSWSTDEAGEALELQDAQGMALIRFARQ
jgi:heat shock protein HslJ